MKIAVVGSSLSGLVAAKELAMAGHDVTVFDQEAKLGARLATARSDHGFFDFGTSFLYPQTEDFTPYVDKLEQKGTLFKWAQSFKHYDGRVLRNEDPNRNSDGYYYASANGMQSVADDLKRWVQVKAGVRVGGLTHIGGGASKKRSWVLNLTDITVFECDAVIVATDAANANGLLQTTQNVTTIRNLTRRIDGIYYYPRYALMASINKEAPSWKGVKCVNSDLAWIGNDSSKHEDSEGTQLTIQSSGHFAEKYQGADQQTITNKLLESASDILDIELTPEATDLYYWKFYEPKKTLEDFFMELEARDAPLALTGNYFKEWSSDAAYLSGLYLAKYWISKFENRGEQLGNTDKKELVGG